MLDLTHQGHCRHEILPAHPEHGTRPRPSHILNDVIDTFSAWGTSRSQCIRKESDKADETIIMFISTFEHQHLKCPSDWYVIAIFVWFNLVWLRQGCCGLTKHPGHCQGHGDSYEELAGAITGIVVKDKQHVHAPLQGCDCTQSQKGISLPTNVSLSRWLFFLLNTFPCWLVSLSPQWWRQGRRRNRRNSRLAVAPLFAPVCAAQWETGLSLMSPPPRYW